MHRTWKCGEFFRNVIGISISHFLPQLAHHTADMSWSKVSVNTLWHASRKLLDGPNIISLRAKKHVLPFVSPKMGVCRARKMFKRNKDMIFEQAFAQSHSTNTNQEFMDEHFPAHTPTLRRYEGEHELFFWPEVGWFLVHRATLGYHVTTCL